MSDEFIDRMQKNAEVLQAMTDEQVLMLGVSEMLVEFAVGKDVPPGTKGKRITLSADLARRAGVKW